MSKLSYQAEAEREERLINAWCKREGLDRSIMTDDDLADIVSWAENDRKQEISDNSQFGVGA